MNGYDISSVQSSLNPASVPGDFVGIKVTEGVGYINPTWETQVKQTLSAGKHLLLYHFITNDSVIEQANFFLNVAKNYVNQAILALDFETGTIGNEIPYITLAHRVQAEVWLNYVSDRTNGRPVIYMNAATAREFDWTSTASKYGLWLAQYASTDPTGYQSHPWRGNSSYGAWNRPTIYQYTSTGSLDNWDGELDLNLAYLSEEEWQEIAGVAGKSENNTNYTTSDLEDDELMKFTYQIIDAKTGKSQGTIYYYDGNKVVALSHQDQLKIVRQIYKDTTGNDLKQYSWRTDAPWYVRFMQAINQKAPEIAWK